MFLQCGSKLMLRIWQSTCFCILFGIGSFFLPGTALSHSPGKMKHDLEHPEKSKPKGMIKFEENNKSSEPGQEYLPEKNSSARPEHAHMGHKMEMTHPSRTRGQHDLMNLGQNNKSQTENLLSRGRNIYLHMCVFCHGKNGDSKGAAVEYLYPWPRDFRKGIFKFRSTPTGTLPTDEDIYRTIVKGVPGTSMPAWGAALSPEDTWALVNLVKSFSTRFAKEPHGKPITLPDPPPVSPTLLNEGKNLFKKHKCVNCHGESGKGDGKLADSLMDVWKHAVFVHDITRPANLKSGHTAKDLFRTLSTGLDGTPMESFAQLPERDRWALVYFIQSQFVEEYKKAEFETDLFSYRVENNLDTDINNPVWEGVKTTDLVLRPLSSRHGAIETINFASVNNGKQIVIRLRWQDPTKNDFKKTRQDYFRDGVAVQFGLGNVTLHTHGHNEPFFGMGNRGKPVNIWHWKAGREEAIQAEEDMEYAGGIDMDALIYGGMRNNPVARMNSFKKSEVEELNAEGFGTITLQPDDRQNVEGHGEWKDGIWTVVFIREMEQSSEWDVNFIRKGPALVAFAVWDGEKEDRNGRKVISVWQRLNILEKKLASPMAKN